MIRKGIRCRQRTSALRWKGMRRKGPTRRYSLWTNGAFRYRRDLWVRV